MDRMFSVRSAACLCTACLTQPATQDPSRLPPRLAPPRLQSTRPSLPSLAAYFCSVRLQQVPHSRQLDAQQRFSLARLQVLGRRVPFQQQWGPKGGNTRMGFKFGCSRGDLRAHHTLGRLKCVQHGPYVLCAQCPACLTPPATQDPSCLLRSRLTLPGRMHTGILTRNGSISRLLGMSRA